MSYNYAHEQKAYDHGYFVGVSESAAKIAALENQLCESKAEHGKTLMLLNTAAYETIPALERKFLIADKALKARGGDVAEMLKWAEGVLISQGKLPQIEVKP